MSHDLNHVALGLHHVEPVLDQMVTRLGARVLHGGYGPGFRGVQVQVGAAGMVVELLEPHGVEVTDFLVRFLGARGEGPHHLTFIVDDLADEVDRLRRLGHRPIGVQLSDPFWKECFLEPGRAHGTVVQIAEMSPHDPTEGDWPRRWWRDPPEAAAGDATLRRVVLGSPRPDQAASFYAEVLGGVPDGPDLCWPGGGRVRFELAADAGIDRFEVADLGSPMEIGGARFAPARD